MADLKALAETLVGLTVKDVQELANILKADYGIEPAAAAVAVAAAPGTGGLRDFDWFAKRLSLSRPPHRGQPAQDQNDHEPPSTLHKSPFVECVRTT